MLDYWSSALYRAQQPSAAVRLALFDPELAPQLPDEPCPYQGLAAFGEDRHEFFLDASACSRRWWSACCAGSGCWPWSAPRAAANRRVALGGLLPTLKLGILPDSEDWRADHPDAGHQPVGQPGACRTGSYWP